MVMQHALEAFLERDDYDFSNTLTRSTVNRYLWQDNPPYLPINFVSQKSSVTIKDGAGSQVAQTTYGYDDVSRIFSYGNAVGQVAAPAGSARGNLNYVSRWLNTTNSMVTTTTNVYDTGEAYQTIDPLGNVTTFSYSTSFYGAYLTQTNLPDTQMPDSGAPVVATLSAAIMISIPEFSPALLMKTVSLIPIPMTSCFALRRATILTVESPNSSIPIQTP